MDVTHFAPLPDFGAPVRAVEIKKSREKVKKSLMEWVLFQGWRWPKTLAADALLEQMELCYVPSWLIEGAASGTWHGEIEDRSTSSSTSSSTCGACHGTGQHQNPTGGYMDPCPSCGGSGLSTSTSYSTTTEWKEGKGHVWTKLNVALPNVADSVGPMLLDTPQIKIKKLVTPVPDLPILRADDTSSEAREVAKTKAARKGLISKVKQQKSSVRKVSIDSMQVQKATISPLLYPAYVGSYTYDGETLNIQIDAVSGKVGAGIPTSILKKRKQDSRIVGAIMAVVFGIIVILTLKPFGIGTGLPTCSSTPGACSSLSTFYTLVVVVAWASVIIGSFAKKILGAYTFVKRLMVGAVVAVLFVALGSTLRIIPQSNLTSFHGLILTVVAFAGGATIGASVLLFLSLVAVWSIFTLKLPDTLTLPLIGIIALCMLLPELLIVSTD